MISSLVPKAFRLQTRKIILAIGRPQEPGLGDFFNRKLQRPLIPLPRFPLLWQVTRPSKHCKHSKDSRQHGQWPAESAITWHCDYSYAPLMPRKMLVMLKYEMYLAHNGTSKWPFHLLPGKVPGNHLSPETKPFVKIQVNNVPLCNVLIKMLILI